MDIRFISSLTPEDENRVGPAVLAAVAALLDCLPLTYTLRVETVGGWSFQHAHSPESEPDDIGATRSGAIIPLDMGRRAG